MKSRATKCIAVFCLSVLAAVLSWPVQAEQGSQLFEVMRRENAALRKELQDVRQQLQASQSEVKAASASQARGQAEMAELGAKLQTAEAGLARWRGELAAAGEAQAELKEGMAKEQLRSGKMTQVMGELKELVDTQASAIDAQHQQIALLEESAVSLRAQAAAAERREEDVAKRIQEARQGLEVKLQQVTGERLKLHYNLAVMYDRQRMYEAAQREYLTCLTLAADDADVHYNLGILYETKLKQPQKAVDHYQRFLELSPSDEDALRVRQWLGQLKVGKPRR